MQVNHKIKLTTAHLPNEFDYPANRYQLVTIAQSYAIDLQLSVAVAGEFDNLSARFANCHRDPGVRKFVTQGAQSRKAQDDIAQLTEVDYENVLGIKSHLKLLASAITQIMTGHLSRLVHA